MRCILVDDEPLAREGMELNIEAVPNLELIGQFGTALAANDFLSKNTVDLMFLDIEMPGITGLEFIESLKNPPLIILTTAYPQYALESYELEVVDYLVKPIRLQRFVKAVNRAKTLFDLQQQNNKNTIENTTESDLFIRADRKYIRLSFDDILYIKGMKDYVMIFTSEQKYMTAMNVGTIYKQLPEERFARVSKSYIINVRYVQAIDIDTIDLNGEEIPLGRSYKSHFIKHYVKGNLIGR